jgi:hypothetical protein
MSTFRQLRIVAKSAWTDFPEIRNRGLSWIPVNKIQIWLKLAKNMGHLLMATKESFVAVAVEVKWCQAVRIAEEVLTLGEHATWPVLFLDKFRRIVCVSGSRFLGFYWKWIPS